MLDRTVEPVESAVRTDDPESYARFVIAACGQLNSRDPGDWGRDMVPRRADTGGSGRSDPARAVAHDLSDGRVVVEPCRGRCRLARAARRGGEATAKRRQPARPRRRLSRTAATTAPTLRAVDNAVAIASRFGASTAIVVGPLVRRCTNSSRMNGTADDGLASHPSSAQIVRVCRSAQRTELLLKPTVAGVINAVSPDGATVPRYLAQRRLTGSALMRALRRCRFNSTREAAKRRAVFIYPFDRNGPRFVTGDLRGSGLHTSQVSKVEIQEIPHHE
jgi:hypothetical protein